MNQELIAQVRRITEKVLKAREQNRQLLAIFGATQRDLDIPLQQLQLCRQHGWKIQLMLSELATKTLALQPIHAVFGEENIWQENEVRNISEIVDTYPQIVLPALDYPMVAKIALRLVDTPSTYLVFEALRKQKKVFAAADAFSERGQDAPAKSLLALEQDYVNALSELGVQWVTAARIAEAINEANSASRTTVETAVISASVIANLTSDVKELCYIPPAVVTPLAREHAQKRGIQLIPKRTSN